jgi:haloalkane dehalogenase
VIPAWVDTREYPFTPRVLDVDAGRMSYLDEGEGPPVVMVHGTPTWSFLYRHLVKALAPRHRCVVPDLPGFGLSDRVAGASYRPEDQTRRLTKLIDTLRLKDFALIVHDFGGPIGLAHAIERPESVRRLVLFNTWMWSFAGEPRVEWFSRLLGGRIGQALYQRRFSTRVMLRNAVVDRTRYTAAVHRHYDAALDTPARRHATWVLARELAGSADWFESLWQRRDRIARHPALLLWGRDDPAFGALLPRWRTVFERATVKEFAGAGHAPPEERAAEVVPLLSEFLAKGESR